ncbi:MAG: hypothetical protein JOY51_08455 [Nevskia sp.]|nr:hypothetical protein [Nevskia sp.]
MAIRPLLQHITEPGALAKAAVVLAGYGAALVIASAAVEMRIALENPADVQGSPGMYAFGDTMYFLFAFCACAALPTAAGLWFLRSSERFWSLLMGSASVIAVTGLAALVVYYAGIRQPIGSPLALAASFAVLRLLIAPVLAGASLLGLLLAPNRRTRIGLFRSMIVELVCAAGIFVHLLW